MGLGRDGRRRPLDSGGWTQRRGFQVKPDPFIEHEIWVAVLALIVHRPWCVHHWSLIPWTSRLEPSICRHYHFYTTTSTTVGPWACTMRQTARFGLSHVQGFYPAPPYGYCWLSSCDQYDFLYMYLVLNNINRIAVLTQYTDTPHEFTHFNSSLRQVRNRTFVNTAVRICIFVNTAVCMYIRIFTYRLPEVKVQQNLIKWFGLAI